MTALHALWYALIRRAHLDLAHHYIATMTLPGVER